MAEHELVGDNAPDDQPPDVVEAKVVVSSLVTMLAGIALALLNAVSADSSILGGLPAWLQFVLITIIPSLITFASGYVTPSNRV